MNIGVYISLHSMIFFGYTPKSGITGSYVSSIFSLKKILILFSIVAVPIYILTSSVGEIHFLYTLSSICCL